MNTPLERAGAVLTIDLDAIAANYRLLREKAEGAECAAVVKANAYGLGAAAVARRLIVEGCTTFFVAHLGEAIDLRAALGEGPDIFVLNGTPPGTARDFLAARAIPVVNSLAELAEWRALAAESGAVMPAALQVDSGMSRLGMAPEEAALLAEDPSLIAGIDVRLVMSHLACADEPGHSANMAQVSEFERLRRILPEARASLANSSGVFLGKAFRHDLVRPGAALYGINPVPGKRNPMRPVVSLKARVVQLREVPQGAGIGYGHALHADAPMRLATLSIGYADGWPRGTRAGAFCGDAPLPLAGRVSMDSIVVDATGLSDDVLWQGAFVDMICANQTVDDVAAASGTIGYEILCSLGRRFHRIYLGDRSVAGDQTP
jgi:alanine racemase